jgi:hypothetical protein
LDINKLTQRIDGIRIECKDLSANCSGVFYRRPFLIPNINRAIADPIQFLGTMDGELSFKVYFDRDYRYHKYRLATSRMPFAWVSSTLTLMACTMFSFLIWEIQCTSVYIDGRFI